MTSLFGRLQAAALNVIAASDKGAEALAHEILALNVVMAEIDTQDKDPERPALVARAKEEYAVGSSDDIEIDEGACLSRTDDGVWVEAWVWLRYDDDDEEDGAEDSASAP